MTRLNQINALVKGRKGETEKHVTDLYKIIQKPDLFDGRLRVYQPKDENGDQLPAEQQAIQYKAKDLLDQATAKWAELWDLVATQDQGNQSAKADIEIELHGPDNKTTKKVLATDVPITTLLFLEKQVTDFETFVSKLPVTDNAREWEYDAQSDKLKAKPIQTTRTKKVPRNHIKYDATANHPAQVEMYMEDIMVGTWTETQFSGKMPAKDKNALLVRVKAVKDAIKLARERANSLEIQSKKVARGIMDFVVGG